MRPYQVAAVAAFAVAPSAHAALIMGQFDGYFFGNYNRTIDGEFIGLDISSDYATYGFAYDTARVPDPDPGFANCPEIRCLYASDNGNLPDDVQWLSVWFDFGEFEGSLIPGTATRQSLFVGNNEPGVEDRMEVGVRGDWYTSFGLVTSDSNPGRYWGPEWMLSDTSPLQSFDSGVGNGIGGGDRHRMGGRLANGQTWEVEFEFYATRLRVMAVPEPSTALLLALGVALLITRKRVRR